jgi:GGDEF domain-containing protein
VDETVRLLLVEDDAAYAAFVGDLPEGVDLLLDRPMPVGHMNLTIRASVGVACGQADCDVDALLARADRAMYAAKRAMTGLGA